MWSPCVGAENLLKMAFTFLLDADEVLLILPANEEANELNQPWRSLFRRKLRQENTCDV
jgi:hypothetical protein